MSQFGQQLFDAANQNDIAKVQELLAKPNIDINWVNAVRTPLQACSVADLVSLRHILVTVCLFVTQNSETPLIQVSYKGHFECARLLVEHHADLNWREKVR